MARRARAEADSPPATRGVSTASFACLALLGGRTLTATQIIEGMRNSGIRYLWPRADSRLYEAPHLLVELGFAEVVGAQTRGRGTQYRATEAGREALRSWLDEPGRPPALEYESLLKVYCSVHGSKAQMLAQIEVMKEHVARGYAVLMKTSARLATKGFEQEPFARMSAMLFEYSRVELDMRARWILEAEELVADWPEGTPSPEELDRIQEWFLVRSQAVADSLRRFRLGEAPVSGLAQ